ncbi:hypothetical protein JCM10908_003093 [Rhodotorula pacifica]|uniref:uncharacterized protein n=1 Tax=Rhodotorula pacifica TaxID=1495444 RepID=UPI00317E388D
MQPSSTLVRPEPYSIRATTTSSHPQLRDLLVHIPEAGNAGGIASVCYDSICSVDCYASAPPEYTPLKFSPSVIATGMGLIAAGGQSSELALKSATPGSDWCFQHIPTASLATSTGVRTLHSGSINNGIFICPAPTSPATPRVLVSSNDEMIKVFEVEGTPPDYRAARRRRERERKEGWSVVEATWAAERGEPVCGPAAAGPSGLRRASRAGCMAESNSEDDVEEQPSYDEGSACRLVPRPDQDIRLSTAVNHCSVSKDGKWLIAVGDTNEVFLYSVPRSDSDQYELAHTFTASSDASFSTDWNEDNRTFAVASQDGFVHVFDIRSLPSCSRPASPTLRAASSSPRKVAELKTSQDGPAGAARKVKFSPGGRKLDAGLMAFTEHRNRIHIVDARTFETYQILDVPLVSSASAFRSTSSPITTTWNPSYVPSAAPPLRPRPQPPPRTFRSRSRPTLSRVPSASFTSLASFDAAGGDSGTCTPRDEKERDELEREMRERSERRAREEDRRVRALANEIRRERRRRVAAETRRRVEAATGTAATTAAGVDDAATDATPLRIIGARTDGTFVYGTAEDESDGTFVHRIGGGEAEVEAEEAMDLDDDVDDTVAADRVDGEAEEEDGEEATTAAAAAAARFSPHGSAGSDFMREWREQRQLRREARAERARLEGRAGLDPSDSEDDDDDDEEQRSGFNATSSEGEGEPHAQIQQDDDEEEEDSEEDMAPVPVRRPAIVEDSEEMSSDEEASEIDMERAGLELRFVQARNEAVRRRMAYRRANGLLPGGDQPPPSSAPTTESDRDPTATLDPPIRRNFIPPASGETYAPVSRGSIGPIRLPSYLSLSRLEGRSGSAQAAGADAPSAQVSSYYSTYVPSSYPSATVSFPTTTSSSSGGVPISNLFSAPLTGGGTYHATSAFFPLDSTPGDLLGLDWDEWGERLFVATGERVWEWEVDARARRGSATWATL